MSIKYSLVMKDGGEIKALYQCFGFLSDLGNPEDYHLSYHGVKDLVVSDIEYIKYDYQYCCFKAATNYNDYDDYDDDYDDDDYECDDAHYDSGVPDDISEHSAKFLAEFELVTSKLPSIQDAFFFKDGYLWVKVKDQPADKVIFILQMARNLAYYVNTSDVTAYSHLRSVGIEPLKSLVFSSLVYIYKHCSWSSPPSEHKVFCGISPLYSNDETLFSSRTFGLESYRRFMAQDNYNPWYQGTFVENGYGYKKQYQQADSGVIFEGLKPLVGVDELFGSQAHYSNNCVKYIHQRSQKIFYSGSIQARHVEDCHSIVGDETPLLPGSVWHPSAGFYSTGLCGGEEVGHETRLSKVIEFIKSL